MKKGTCAPLEGSIPGMMGIMNTAVAAMTVGMCLNLHKKFDTAPEQNKAPVQNPHNNMQRKPSFF